MATNKQNKYGYDMSFFLDIRKNASATSGIDLVKDAIAGRILDHNLWYANNYGINLIGKIREHKSNNWEDLEEETKVELLKDSRISEIEVIIVGPTDETVTVTIAGITSEEEEFNLIGRLSNQDAEDFIFI